MLTFKTSSPEETRDFGRKLASLLKAGDIICLLGNLGAGKTLLTQGIAAGLGVDEATSPTFTIMNVYESQIPIYHFDLYRLDDPSELMDVGYFEYTGTDGLAIIEWADKFPESMPDEYLSVEIKPGEQADQRLITLNPMGMRYEKICEELKQIAGSRFGYSDLSI